ncbi:DedA family protein [uncultured Cellulomonas sp.]|uniref:DedA family protein n=1 Tax=uncultured Cellulomonas sp. TaxID=189682 RepID=UPI0026086469|nr:VTT domain-containing protein [uncultured Cellulomonas sp.]
MPELAAWADVAAGSPWVLVLLWLTTTLDGVLPLVPSESLVIGLAALPAVSGRPSLWLLGAAAAAGAFCGDQLAYSFGRRVPLRGLRVLRSARGQRAVDRAERALRHRGAAFIIGARFVPGGRVAVAMAAGAARFSRRRFSAIAAVAALLWSAYSLALGVGAGQLLDRHHPVVGVVAGVAGGLLTGAVVDRVLQRLSRTRGAGRAAPPAPAAAPPATPAVVGADPCGPR